MAVTYFPFDAGAGAAVTESQWNQMARLWLRTGVARGQLNEFATFADSTGMQVKVPSGQAWIEGSFVQSDAQTTLAIGTAHATLARIDRVVLRRDSVGNTIALVVLAGTPASTPAPPAITQTASTWDLPLAQVLVPAAAATITAGNVTDERTFAQNVDVDAVQTLKNKTLITPTITDLTNMQHTHLNPAGGGVIAQARSMWVPAEYLKPYGNSVLAPVSGGVGEYELQCAANQGGINYLPVPSNYTVGTTYQVRLHWHTPSAGQTVTWSLYTALIDPGDSLTEAWALAGNTGAVNSHATANAETVNAITGIAMATSNAGKLLRFLIYRESGGTAETARLIGAEVIWG